MSFSNCLLYVCGGVCLPVDLSIWAVTIEIWNCHSLPWDACMLGGISESQDFIWKYQLIVGFDLSVHFIWKVDWVVQFIWNGGYIWIWTIHMKISTHSGFWFQYALHLISWQSCSVHLKWGGISESEHFIWKLGLFMLHTKDLMNNNSMTH